MSDSPADPSGSTEQFRAFVHGGGQPAPERSKTPLIVGVVVAVVALLALLAVLAFFLM